MNNCRKNGFTLFALCLLFGLSLPCLSYSEEVPTTRLYDSELIRLKAISARLQAISIALDLKLSDSEQSLRMLSDELETLKVELQGLKNQLATSLQRSETLEGMLAKSEVSLARLTESFKVYRDDVEKKIASLERRARFWSFIGKLALAVAAGEGAYIAVNHFF